MPHTQKSISKHLSRYYPNCPEEDAKIISESLQSEQYRDIDLKTAIAMCMRVYVRKNKTDYENLMQVDALTRNEAILIVREEVADIIQTWRK